MTAEFVLKSSLRHAFESEDLNLGSISELMDEAAREQVSLDTTLLSYVLKSRLESLANQLEANPADGHVFRQFERAVRLATTLPFDVDLWKAQNVSYHILQNICAGNTMDIKDQPWLERWLDIATRLSLRCEHLFTMAEPISPAIEAA
jgi:hypothetical protein